MKRNLVPMALLLTLITACQTFEANPEHVEYNDLLLSTEGEHLTLPGADIVNARLLVDPGVDDGYKIVIVFSKEGTALFAAMTGRALGKQLAISASGKTLLSATIRQPIADGRMVVTGYKRDDAKRIFDALVKKPEPVPQG